MTSGKIKANSAVPAGIASAGLIRSRPAWLRYTFAIALTIAVCVLRYEVGKLVGERLPLPLFGLGAIIGCIWYAGAGPSVVASLFITAWYVAESRGLVFSNLDGTDPYLWSHCCIFLLETAVLCAFGNQMHSMAEKAARGEDWQRHLVETAGEGIWIVNTEGVIDYANPRMAEILGYRPGQLTGRQFESFLFPVDLPAEQIRFQNRRPGIREQYDRRLRHANGSEVWTLACTSLYAHGGKDSGLLTMMTDITERRKAEYALRQSERKFRGLFENIREGVYQTTPDGRILAANPELLRMLGFSKREQLDVPGVVRDTFVDAETHRRLRDRLESDGSYTNVEFQLRTRDHRIITVRENARVVFSEAGDVLYYEGTLTDITEQIQLEKQLRLAQKAEAVGRLAGGIAQDFRNLGIGMMRDLQISLRVLSPDHPAHPHIANVARSMEGAAGLTRQILNFSQRHITGNEVLGINTFLRALEPELRGLAEPDFSLTLSLCPEPAPALADADHLRQIVTGWLIHVRRHEWKVAEIEVATAIVAASHDGTPGPFVSLSVRGTGAREASAASLPIAGTSTTQAILAQFGATMAAAADPSSGICYTVYLPLSAPAPQALETPPAIGLERRTETVFLVEEEPLIRELSRDMLERQGFRVLTAGTTTEARRMAKLSPAFHVLVTGWAAKDGSELVQLLQEMHPTLRVLFIAGYADGTPDTTGLPEGTAVLQKPFSGDSLGRRIRQLLDQPPAQ